MTLLAELAKAQNMEEADLHEFLRHAPKMYKVYKIPKRSVGHRVIAQPSSNLKKLQRTFVDIYKLPVHHCAMAYRSGFSIKDNADRHRKNDYLLKMDFENFFNSITPELLFKSWNNHDFNWTRKDQTQLKRLLFWCPSKNRSGKHILSVGAPSSPVVSNSLLYFFDQDLKIWCDQFGVVYTRYADDVTLSSREKNVLYGVPAVVKELLQKHFHDSITLNNGKTVYSSRAHNRHVTGITLTNQGTLSIGRKRKRYLKHLVHQYAIGCLDAEDIKHLQGLLSFCKYIEPKFIFSLQNKYGAEVLIKIMAVGK